MQRNLLHLCIAIAMTSMVAAAGTTPIGAADWNGRLAAELSIDKARLESVQVSGETLSDGRTVVTVKAIDRETREVVGRSFQRDSVVDRDELRRESDNRWRFAHGAMTSALLARLDGLPANDELTLDLWYAFSPPDTIEPEGGRDPQVEGHEGFGGEAAGAEAPLPLAAEQARAVERMAVLAAQGSAAPVSADAPEKPLDNQVEGTELAARKAQSMASAAAAESVNQLRIAEVRAAMSQSRQEMLDKLVAAGVTVHYASDIVPSIIVSMPRAKIDVVARWFDVAMLDLVPDTTGPELSVARPTHNITPINTVGYDGSGVTVAVVEGNRVYAQNPFLTVSQTRNSAVATSDHTMRVAGIIASSHGTERGMASGATVISADGEYNTDGVLETATDWAAARAQVLNHSWGASGVTEAGLNAFDRRLDYIARVLNRLNVKSAGNVGAVNCGNPPSTTAFRVTSPGRGYNTLTVGGFNDGGTQAWGNDSLYGCSAFLNPLGDSASAEHEKPEVVASAVSITSLAQTTSSTSALASADTGTSFAAPAVSGLAAALMEADSQLLTSPVATRTLIIAGAGRDIVGGGPISDQDGAGAIRGTASVASAENGPWWFRGVDGGSFPLNYNVHAQAGQRVRFVINWLSNVTLNAGTYSNDRLPADLDLRAYRSDGTTLVAWSISTPNAFEVVDFVAPVTDTYVMRVSLYGSWTGSAVPFAAAASLDSNPLPRGTWWSLNGAPGLQGRFYHVQPDTDYSGWTNYWRGVALRPATSGDYDLQLFDASWFEQPTSADAYNRPMLGSSGFGYGGVDFILVDGNHWPDSKREHYRVFRYGGSGAYVVNAANGAYFNSSSTGTYGPYSLDANSALWVGDIAFDTASERRITVIPGIGAGGSDLGLSLYRSDPGNSATWARSRNGFVATSDSGGAGVGERLRYRNDAAPDFLGFAVFNKTQGTSPQFYIKVTPNAIFAEGFDSVW